MISLILPFSKSASYIALSILLGLLDISFSSAQQKPPTPTSSLSPETLPLLVGSHLLTARPEVMELGQGWLMNNSGKWLSGTGA